MYMLVSGLGYGSKVPRQAQGCCCPGCWVLALSRQLGWAGWAGLAGPHSNSRWTGGFPPLIQIRPFHLLPALTHTYPPSLITTIRFFKPKFLINKTVIYSQNIYVFLYFK